MKQGEGVNAVLDQLFSKSTVTLDNPKKDVTIKKVTLRYLKPITDLLGRVMEDLKLDVSTQPTVDLQDPAVILKLISKYYDEVVKLAVSLTDLTEDELLDMDPDQSVRVIQGVIELNKRFFTEKVLPALRQMGVAFDAS